MTTMFKNFASDESGAVTVDWVVLTAALVGLGLAVMAVVSGGVETLSNSISTDLGAIQPNTNPFEANGAATANND
jgi:Flp pilus assembly pilin Flp